MNPPTPQTSTPETDAASFYFQPESIRVQTADKYAGTVVYALFARKLERERDKARQQILNQASIIKDIATPVTEREQRLLKERDQLRAELSEANINCGIWKKGTAALIKERDSLQSQLAEANRKIEILKDACDRSDTISAERLAQLEALRKDKERLDWLDKKRATHIYEHFKFHQSMAATQATWRTAIDTAVQGGK